MSSVAVAEAEAEVEVVVAAVLVAPARVLAVRAPARAVLVALARAVLAAPVDLPRLAPSSLYFQAPDQTQAQQTGVEARFAHVGRALGSVGTTSTRSASARRRHSR